MLRLSQSTWNGSKPRFAHFEAARQFLLRKLEQGLCVGTACGKGVSKREYLSPMALKMVHS
jgi:hypothetical protein